jgi:hypothetical protein
MAPLLRLKLFPNLRFRFGIYAPGQGPADFNLFDEVWPNWEKWDGRSRGLIVIDVDFPVIGGDTGTVRAIREDGVIIGVSRRTHVLLRSWDDPEPEVFCFTCDHPRRSHFCASVMSEECRESKDHYHNGGYSGPSEEHGGCKYLNCKCPKWRLWDGDLQSDSG